MQNRTHTCNELRMSDCGKTVELSGWMENVREVSASLAFVVLRDFYGTTQIVVESEDMMQVIHGLNKESVIAVEGVDPGTLLIGEPLQTKDGDAELVEYLAEVLYQLEGRGLYTQVDSIDFSDKNHVSFSYGDKYTVKLGGPGKTEYKFGMLVSVMSQLLSGDVGVIDVSDGMTARFRPE